MTVLAIAQYLHAIGEKDAELIEEGKAIALFMIGSQRATMAPSAKRFASTETTGWNWTSRNFRPTSEEQSRLLSQDFTRF
jgi:hypothetical protein